MDWLKRHLPSSAAHALEWLYDPELLAVLSVASIVLFIASLIAIPWFVARLPPDYFCVHRGRHSLLHAENPNLRAFLHVAKNVVGGLLLLLGFAMLVLPGQGIVTILIGLVLLDLPGKRRLLARIAARPRVARALNAIRERHGQLPLEFDAE